MSSPQCCSDQDQCSEHKIQHMALFDEKEHAISIRSSEKFCLGEKFFLRSYIVKYPGIPVKCQKCRRDLLNHHSYHFDCHLKCRFCKQILYKFRATTEKELHKVEKAESEYFKTVCPYCDRRFRDSVNAKRHIKFEHGDSSFKCDLFAKVFHSEQAKKYHVMVKHDTSPDNSVTCDVCNKNFPSEVSLKNHQKYVHSESRNHSCPHCKARFKQKKTLRDHIVNIHDINHRLEDYQEIEEKKVIKCELCKSTFKYRKNLNSHILAKHSDYDNGKCFECEDCEAKFKSKRSLVAHQKLKHGQEKEMYNCSVCDKVFIEKKNLKKHERKHEIN